MKLWIRRGIAVTMLGIILGAVVAGCGSSGTAGGGGTVEGGSLTLSLPADPGNLDPQRSVDGQNLLLSVFAYDTPVKLMNSGEIAPEVVTKWKPGNHSYALTVGKGITCADGTPMDAKVVAENINYVGDAENGSPMTGIAVPSGATATAAGDTVTVKLEEESPFFMQSIAELPLICSKGLADRGSLAKASDGSGPYVLAGAKPGVSYEFTLRKGYKWGPNGAATSAKGMPAKLTFNVVNSSTTVANQLLGGQVNVAQVSGSDAKRLEAANLFSSGSNLMATEIAFNEAPGNDVDSAEVRRALISALNLPALAKIDTGGLGKPADGLIASPKICAGNTMTGNTPEYDPAAAKEVLEGKGVSVLLVFSNSTPTTSATAQYIAHQWEEAGVSVSLKQQSFDQTSATVFGHGNWDATLIGLGVNNPSVLVPFFTGPSPTAGNNFGHFHNAEYERLTASAMNKPGKQGCGDWNAAEGALFKEADITPVSTQALLYWGKGAEFEANMGVLFPTSLRVTG